MLGGTGFVGRALAARLVDTGHRLRILTRRRDRHRDLLVLPQTVLVQGDVHDIGFLREQFTGMDAVIHLVGILNEHGKRQSFERVHVELPAKVVQACRERGVGRLLHMSALHADPMAPSHYLRTKARGEEAVREIVDVDATIFRPSVIFGRHDSFTNRFARLLRLSPGIFPLACPQARFQPVYVDDVVRAFIDSLDEHRAFGQTYDLCGPRVYTLHELVTYIARLQRLPRRIIGLSDGLSRLQAAVLELVPGKPFTRDNYHSLQVDNVCDAGGALKTVFGISPTPLEQVVPGYIGAA